MCHVAYLLHSLLLSFNNNVHGFVDIQIFVVQFGCIINYSNVLHFIFVAGLEPVTAITLGNCKIGEHPRLTVYLSILVWVFKTKL